MLTREDTIANISSYYKVNPQQTSKVVKKYNNEYKTYKFKRQQDINQIFPENMGEYLHIDEVALSKGELYTFVTNPEGRGKEGTMVAIIEGTKADDIAEVLDRLSLYRRKQVKAVASDMAPNMQAALRRSFPNALIVIDRFHVVKLIIEALQAQRIKYRWQVIEQENERMKFCREENITYKIRTYPNGDTEKQLLARSTYLLFKSSDKWTRSQKIRAAILFENYPRLKVLYEHSMAFRNIYNEVSPEKAQLRLEQWIDKSCRLRENVFHTAAGSVRNHMTNILNYFKIKLTNAFAESFNSKIKRFRFNLRGVSDPIFFHFRLIKLFA